MVKVGEYEVREGLYYSKDFFWVKVEGNKARCGLTDYAQKMLKSIVYIDAPKAGTDVSQGEVCGSIESIKTVSDLISPLNGKVVDYNVALDKNPGLINSDPYGQGWIFIIESPSLQSDLSNLMDLNKAVEWHKELLNK
ncbi:MAG: glycine cleavage system protein GcvH [Nitrososphaerales archaeon]